MHVTLYLSTGISATVASTFEEEKEIAFFSFYLNRAWIMASKSDNTPTKSVAIIYHCYYPHRSGAFGKESILIAFDRITISFVAWHKSYSIEARLLWFVRFEETLVAMESGGG